MPGRPAGRTLRGRGWSSSLARQANPLEAWVRIPPPALSIASRTEVTVMAKGNNAQGKDKRKAKANPKKGAKGSPKKPAPTMKKS